MQSVASEVPKAPVEAENGGAPPPSPPKPATETPAPTVPVAETTTEKVEGETKPVLDTLPPSVEEEKVEEKEVEAEKEGEERELVAQGEVEVEAGEGEEPPTKRQCLSGGQSIPTGQEAEERERPRRQPQAHAGRSTQARPFSFRTELRTGHRAGSVQSTLQRDLQECDKQFKSKGFSKRRVGKFGELGVKRTEAKKSTEFDEFNFMKREAAKRSKSEVGQMTPSEIRRASIEARTLQAVSESPKSGHPLQKPADGGMAFRATPKPAFRESRVFRPRCSHRSTVPHPFKLRIDGRMDREEASTPKAEHKAKKQVTAFRSTSLSTAPMVKRL